MDCVFISENFLNKVNIVLIHVGYLLLGMLTLVFVNAANFYRIFFVIAVAINFATSILDYYHLDVQQFSAMIATVFFGNFIRNIIIANIGAINGSVQSSASTNNNNDDDDNENNNVCDVEYVNSFRSANPHTSRHFANVSQEHTRRSMTPVVSRFLKYENTHSRR